MEQVSFENSNNPAIVMSAIMHVPDGFTPQGTYPSLVVTHPSGGVKEQTADLYAAKLASEGFVTIATDASYRGDSGGEPRGLENPHIRTEDISAVVDHLVTLPYVDRDRIGAMGMCAGGGYTVNAAINDRRIRAVGVVSPVNLGAGLREGLYRDQPIADAFAMLEQGAEARTAQALGAEAPMFPLVQDTEEDAPSEELRQVWEYYFTARAAHPRATGYGTTRSLTQILTYDAFHLAEVFLTQPLLVVAGSEAGTRWMGEDLFARAASEDKSVHTVDDALHMDLYDRQPFVDEAVSALGPFFARTLARAEVAVP